MRINIIFVEHNEEKDTQYRNKVDWHFFLNDKHNINVPLDIEDG